MNERPATYDGSWSKLKVQPRNLDSAPEISSPVAKRKAGLQTLDGHVFGTITRSEYDRLRAEDPIHVVTHQPSTHGGEAA